MLQTTTDYTLTLNDMAAFKALLKLQGDVGAGMPPPGQAQLWDFFGIINDMAYQHYRLADNTQLKGWMNSTFTVVISTNTSYTIDGKNLGAAGMYLLYMYYQFNAACMVQDGYEPTCKGGFPAGAYDQKIGTWLTSNNEGLSNTWPWNWFGPVGTSIFFAPTTVPGFYDALVTNGQLLNHGLVIQKGSTETVAIGFTGYPDARTEHTLAEVQQFEQSRFDPANWTNSSALVQNLQQTTIWQEQSATVGSLLKEPELSADAYFFLLHLLIGLGTSNQTDRQLAQKIVNSTVSSIEYPNDTFINQLVYLTLMYFADPIGNYNYDNTQLQGLLNDFSAVIVSTDAASAAIKQSLTKSLRILHGDASYPMTDPYNPNIGFNTRMADTLAALDGARSSLV